MGTHSYFLHWTARVPISLNGHKIYDIFIMNVYEYIGVIMANTSLTLGEHWEVFIKNEVASGRYGSASEVMRDALRTLEERKTRLDSLRMHLAEGAAQAQRGEYVNQSLDAMLSEFKEGRNEQNL